jgi:4-methylaminobutanoate oxidase (formaldehyde-forming)
MGWEIPDWYAPSGIEPSVEYSWGRQNWFEYLAAEHKACREDVILMDVTSMSKFLVQGRDAERVLNNICANDVAVPVGKIVYTQWLNERGTLEADLTVTRLAEDKYFIVSAGDFYTHDLYWLKKHIPNDAHAFVTDVTSGYTLINIQGPKSRNLLSRITSVDLSNDSFPYMTAKEIDLNYARPLALRVTYEGELGWELHVPAEFSIHVYETLIEFGQEFGLKHAGFQALNTLRIEKAYREYAHDMDNTHTPLLHGTEVIYRDGKSVGYLTTAGYGFTLGGAVGMGFVKHNDGVSSDFIKNGKFEIDIAGERFLAKASLRPMYDPKNERVRSKKQIININSSV